MKYGTRNLAALVALGLAAPVMAWDGCDNQRIIEETLDLSSSQLLQIAAGAGALEITGEAGRDTAAVKATICASESEYAEASGLDVSTGDTARIATVMPDFDGNGGWGSNRYLYMDLEIVVPDSMSLDVRDSSGDLSMRKVGAVKVQDSSGDIEIISAISVELQDSSGDIDLEQISGDVVVVSDSSGDMRGEEISGSVLVAKDSSGNIRFSEVGKDFIVERDSSGDIVAKTVAGDFSVLKDGSGSIRYSDVLGDVQIPDDKD